MQKEREGKKERQAEDGMTNPDAVQKQKKARRFRVALKAYGWRLLGTSLSWAAWDW